MRIVHASSPTFVTSTVFDAWTGTILVIANHPNSFTNSGDLVHSVAAKHPRLLAFLG